MAHVLDLRDGVDPLRELTERFVDLVPRPDRRDKTYGTYFVASDSEFAPLARFVEREVFAERFANTSETMDAEYDPYEAASYFVIAVDYSAMEPVGVVRRIMPNPRGLKTLNDMSEIPEWRVSLEEIRSRHGDVRLETTSDLATLAVRRRWERIQGVPVSAGLYHTAYSGALMSNIRHEVFALDGSAKSTELISVVPFERICDLPEIEYLGSPNTAPYIGDTEVGRQKLEEGDPILRMIAYAEGLEPFFSFPVIDLTRPEITVPTDVEPQGRRVGTGANV